MTGTPLAAYAVPRQGFATGSNDKFLRCWHEVSVRTIGIGCQSPEEADLSGARWFPCNKGGEFRKWYGNNIIVADWENDGLRMKAFAGSVIRNPSYYFREGNDMVNG